MGDKKEKEEVPMYIAINRAKGLMVDAVGQVLNATRIPPFAMDGILCSILADIRQKEMYDLGVVYSSVNSNNEHMEETDGEHK